MLVLKRPTSDKPADVLPRQRTGSKHAITRASEPTSESEQTAYFESQTNPWEDLHHSENLVFVDRTLSQPSWIEGARAQLKAAESLQAGWNGYSAPAPHPWSIEEARRFCDSVWLQGIKPSRVAPSAVGGIGITFRNGSQKVYVEFLNDQSIYALYSQRSVDPSVQPIRLDNPAEEMEFINGIRNHLGI